MESLGDLKSVKVGLLSPRHSTSRRRRVRIAGRLTAAAEQRARSRRQPRTVSVPRSAVPPICSRGPQLHGPYLYPVPSVGGALEWRTRNSRPERVPEPEWIERAGSISRAQIQCGAPGPAPAVACMTHTWTLWLTSALSVRQHISQK